MNEQLIHANCGGDITQDIQTEIYSCDKYDEASISFQHTTEGEAIILKQTTEAEVKKIEQVADESGITIADRTTSMPPKDLLFRK